MDYKIIAPNLITLETDLKKIKGFYLLNDLQYFGSSEDKLKFHFKAMIDNNIQVAANYNFRNSRYQVKNDVWTYNFFQWGLNFIFQYDYTHKQFSFNWLANKLPFRLNWIHPAGDHLADIINLELFINGIIVLNGIAFQSDNGSHAFCTPSRNGKTTFLGKNRGKFEEIISDDYVLLDLKNKKIVNTPLLEKGKNLTTKWHSIEKINMIINTTNSGNKMQFTAREFVRMSAMKFQDNLFIKNLIFYYHLEKAIDNVLDEIESSDIFELASIKNYDYEQLIRS